MRKTKWGVISTARIGREKVIPGIQRSRTAEVAAIASRDLKTAEETAHALGIPRAYGSYEALLADPGIEIVYNPLPNHLHVPLTMQAAAAGKHVLCEKPAALNAEEASQLLKAPAGVRIMEAFMVRFHPQWIAARDILRSGAIGEVRAIQMFFSFYNVDAGNIRNMADIGGGAMMDIGCYPITAGRYFFEGEPTRAIGLIDRDPTFRTDRLTTAILDFGAGRRLDFTVSTQLSRFQRLEILGTKGRVEILIPVNAPAMEPTIISLDLAGEGGDASAEKRTIPACDQYAEQADAFSAFVRGEIDLPYGAADAVQSMRIIDAIVRSEKSGAWEKIAG
ncbi:Gfo/Idh/MocA family oxidoreductase [Terrarubrum flagellatum]|uniref:Gfo/Idh/MocA family protein n=1 Tax=Terrirubrum flagellatum TaxID=2895980 RepID=UPI0031456D14